MAVTATTTGVEEAGTPAASPSTSRAVAVSAGGQVVAKVLHLGLNLASSLAVIRYLGPGDYGDYVLVIATTTFLGLVSDFGIPRLAVREVSAGCDDEGTLVGSALAARIALSAVAAVLVQAVLLAVGASAEVRIAGAIASGLFVAEALLTALVVFHVRLEQQYDAIVRTVAELVDTSLVLAVIALHGPLVALVAAPVVGTFVGGGLALRLVRRRHRIRLRVDPSVARRLVRMALPVGPAMLIGVAYLKLGGVILGARASSIEVGLYGAAFQPIEYLFLAAAIVTNVLFPLLARWYAGDAERFTMLYARGTEILLALALPVPIVLVIAGDDLVRGVYDSAYAGAVAPMTLLGFALVLMTVNVWQALTLLAAHRQRITLAYDAVALAVAVLLNLALARRHGATGTAVATVATTVFVTACSTVAVRRCTRARLALSGLARLAVAAAVGGAAGRVAVAALPAGVAAVIAVTVYLSLVLCSRVIRPAALRALVDGTGDHPSINRLGAVA